MMVALRIIQGNEKTRASSKKNKIGKKRGCYKIILILLGQIKDTFGTNKKLNTFMKVLDYRFIG